MSANWPLTHNKLRFHNENSENPLISSYPYIILIQVNGKYDYIPPFMCERRKSKFLSLLANRLLTKIRPLVEQGNEEDKHRFGLESFFVNSLKLARVLSLLADS